MITKEEIIKILNLKPHPAEGGYFAETYRAKEIIPKSGLPGRYDHNRVMSTAIYFMITADTYSAMHRLKSDEVFHFYFGDPVEMLNLCPDDSGRVITIGNDLMNGMQPQVVVPNGVWQGARLHQGGKFALLGTTVAPGFEYPDFELGNRDKLIKQYPQYRELIISLTKSIK
ncbi:MAG: cupin domain-containing protein [bacterium]